MRTCHLTVCRTVNQWERYRTYPLLLYPQSTVYKFKKSWQCMPVPTSSDASNSWPDGEPLFVVFFFLIGIRKILWSVLTWTELVLCLNIFAACLFDRNDLQLRQSDRTWWSTILLLFAVNQGLMHLPRLYTSWCLLYPNLHNYICIENFELATAIVFMPKVVPRLSGCPPRVIFELDCKWRNHSLERFCPWAFVDCMSLCFLYACFMVSRVLWFECLRAFLCFCVCDYAAVE